MFASRRCASMYSSIKQEKEEKRNKRKKARKAEYNMMIHNVKRQRRHPLEVGETICLRALPDDRMVIY